jgi:hypothetical protein
MNEKTSEKIQKCVEALCDVVSKEAGTSNVYIGWSVIEGDDVYSGISLGDTLSKEDLSHCMFQLNGRAYAMTQED